MTELAEVAGQPLHDPARRHERPVDLVAEHDRCEVLLRRIDVGELPAPQLGERQRPPRRVDLDRESR